ncbi:MAG: hypothetical protein OEV50_02845 [Candidatus Aminicenantes bacterium]|nr:hypothetical protein [Candidatus Aminicenantes bacterium]
MHRKHAGFAPASQSLLGFRLRSPLLRRGTVPAPPSNGFLNTQPDLSYNFILTLSIMQVDILSAVP